METSTPGNGRTIEKALFIRATPQLVFRALTEPSDDTGNTLATIRVQGTARLFYGLADFLMAPMVKRNLNNDLRRLKAHMEKE